MRAGTYYGSGEVGLGVGLFIFVLKLLSCFLVGWLVFNRGPFGVQKIEDGDETAVDFNLFTHA